ncbi:Na+/H+ antiporter [Corticimicrobacter populi]|uniref:Na+/H+ antiporter n=2 Tax=Corticimicrobacter populi TaxID=2175229 RepID=A0A2V1K1V4_9BURK|nr:Na+/H+ antiporter [Corticimicrobacter populi]
MDTIGLVLVMLLAVVVSGWIVRLLPIAIPLPLVQIALGAVMASIFQYDIQLEPHIFFLLFLPPLLFLDGWRIPKRDLLQDKTMIIQLALGLVIFTVIGLGYLIHWMIPAMPLAVAFALAAIVSPTDPVAVSSIAARIPIPKRLMHILEGESLLNDASGLVCFRFAVAAAVTGTFSLPHATLTFLWVAAGGLLCGAGFTLAISYAQTWLGRRIGEEPGAQILVSVLIPFGAYLLAEEVGASGILAAVAAGVAMSYVELSGRALAATRIQRKSLWDMIQFSLNGIMFVLLGEQLPGIFEGAVRVVQETGHENPWWLLVYALVINIALGLLRFGWVRLCLLINGWIARRRGQAETQVGMRLTAAVSLAGVRGAVTLAGVLTLPLLLPNGEAFPARDLAIFLAATVTIISLITANLGLPRLLKGLHIPDISSQATEEAQARRLAADAAIHAIEQSQHTLEARYENPQLCAEAAARAMDAYRRKIEAGTIAAEEASDLRLGASIEQELRLTGLQAERAAVFRLAREHRITDETSRKLVHEIDLMEARLR